MGIEFIRKKGGAIRKRWENDARKAAIPDLFTKHPECKTRSVLVDLIGGIDVKPKEPLLLKCAGDGLVAMREMVVVGHSKTPPNDLLSIIRESGGCAVGEASKKFDLSGTIEVKVKR